MEFRYYARLRARDFSEERNIVVQIFVYWMKYRLPRFD